MPRNVVVIEDDPQIRRFLRTLLDAEGWTVHEAETGKQGLVEAATRKPDVVILDLGLPDIDGVEVMRRLREWSAGADAGAVGAHPRGGQGRARSTPARTTTSPSRSARPSCSARLRVAVRHGAMRAADAPSAKVVVDGLEVDLAARRVRVDDADVHLTPIEYRLLATLARHAGMVLTHRQILKEVWGLPYEDNTHTLRVHMASLRRKIERDTAQPRYLLSELGVGYRLAGE